MSRARPTSAALAGSILLIVAIYSVLSRERGPSVLHSPAETEQIGTPGESGREIRTLGSGESSSSVRTPVSSNDPEPAPRMAGLQVAGSVTDPHGAPVGGARVELRLTVGKNAVISDAIALTDPAGTYQALMEGWRELPAVSRSTLRLSGRASASLLHEWRWTFADRVSAGSDRARLDLRVQPGAMLTGRVLLADGRPCGGAVVRPSSDEERRAPWRRTDQHGRYMIPILEGGRFEITATHRGFGVSDAVSVDLHRCIDLRAPDPVIRSGESLTGIVVYPEGRPAGRLALEAKPIHADPDHEIGIGLRQGRTETDLDGRFTFAGLLPGEYTISCPTAGAELTCEREFFATGERQARLTLRLYRLRVRIVDEQARGVLGAKFSYSYPRSETIFHSSSRTIQSADGIKFIDIPWLEPPREYTYEVAVQLTEAVGGKFTIEAGQFETPVELVLEAREH